MSRAFLVHILYETGVARQFDTLMNTAGRLPGTMPGITKEQYQKEKTRRLDQRRDRLVVKAKAILNRASLLDAKYGEQAVLTFVQHRELEEINDRLTTHLNLMDPQSILFPLSEIRLRMAEDSLANLETRLAKLESQLH